MDKGIKVLDHQEVITFIYEDALKYHGRQFIGGVALAYRLLEWGLPKLSDEIPERGYFSFYSGIGENGKGIIDTVELILRVKTHQQLFLDFDYAVDKPGPLAPNAGKYYFELGYKDKKIGIALKEGLLPENFITYSKMAYAKRQRGEELTSQDKEKLVQVREQVADAVMLLDAEDMFVLVDIPN